MNDFLKLYSTKNNDIQQLSFRGVHQTNHKNSVES